MTNALKIPFAVDKLTGELVEIFDVEEGLNCNCKCPVCNEDLKAVKSSKIRKDGTPRRSYFSHLSDTKHSKGTGLESFYHWAAKEVFKKGKTIILPPITVRLLDIRELASWCSDLDIYYSGVGSAVLKKEQEVTFDNVDSEIFVRNPFGDMVPDIIFANSNGSKIFIEPFVTNEINYLKRLKLQKLDVSTISIDLNPFIEKNKDDFSLEEFAEFLIQDISSKKWELINSEYLNQTKKEFINNLKSGHEIDEKKALELIKKRASLQKEIKRLDHSINMITKKIEKSIDEIRPF